MKFSPDRLSEKEKLEHLTVSFKIICDRAVSHEIVRHRVASYAQESTRYVNYNKKGMTFIKPCFWEEGSDEYGVWASSCRMAEQAYSGLTAIGAKPEEARSVLPNSLKTEIVCTMNLREIRHFLKLRTAKAAHPQMVQVANMLLEQLKVKVPVVFDDIIGV
jgi:thymidylate synthase (FAD)